MEDRTINPNEDAISREATLAKFKKVYFDNKTVIRCAELILGSMPPVNSQPKKGYWIKNTVRKNLCNCSECMALSNVYSDFCPHCGTKMVEPQESEE